nr:hypothetical protein [uncultured Albidiferax sp.]
MSQIPVEDRAEVIAQDAQPERGGPIPIETLAPLIAQAMKLAPEIKRREECREVDPALASRQREWLGQDAWTHRQAALLAYGYDPRTWRDKTLYEIPTRFVSCQRWTGSMGTGVTTFDDVERMIESLDLRAERTISPPDFSAWLARNRPGFDVRWLTTASAAPASTGGKAPEWSVKPVGDFHPLRTPLRDYLETCSRAGNPVPTCHDVLRDWNTKKPASVCLKVFQNRLELVATGAGPENWDKKNIQVEINNLVVPPPVNESTLERRERLQKEVMERTKEVGNPRGVKQWVADQNAITRQTLADILKRPAKKTAAKVAPDSFFSSLGARVVRS